MFVDDDEEPPSPHLKDLSPRSAELIILKIFNAVSIHFLTIKHHMWPLGKILNVKCRSLGKYQLLVPLAKPLVDNGHVSVSGDPINFRNLERNQINVISDFNNLISKNKSSQSGSLADDASVSDDRQL